MLMLRAAGCLRLLRRLQLMTDFRIMLYVKQIQNDSFVDNSTFRPYNNSSFSKLLTWPVVSIFTYDPGLKPGAIDIYPDSGHPVISALYSKIIFE